MWKSACVGVYQLVNWKFHGETLKLEKRRVFDLDSLGIRVWFSIGGEKNSLFFHNF